MAVSPVYTPVNSINWEIRDLSNQHIWSSPTEKENQVLISKPHEPKRKRCDQQPLAPRIKQCRDDMRTIMDLVAEEHRDRAAMHQRLLDVEQRALEDKCRIQELENLVSQSLKIRDTPRQTEEASSEWKKEREELYLQLGELKREKGRQDEEYTHIQARLEAKTDDLHRQKEAQGREIERLRALVEELTVKDAARVKHIENLQRIQRRATKDKNDVLETLEAGLDEARNEAAASRRQVEEILEDTEKQIMAAEVRGRDAQLKELRSLSPRAVLSLLTQPQQRTGVWGWLGSA